MNVEIFITSEENTVFANSETLITRRWMYPLVWLMPLARRVQWTCRYSPNMRLVLLKRILHLEKPPEGPASCRSSATWEDNVEMDLKKRVRLQLPQDSLLYTAA